MATGVESPALASRYGRRRGRGRRWPVVIAATTLWSIGLAWLAWVIIDQISPAVQSQMLTYSVDDDGRRARASVSVQLEEVTTIASCLVRATAADSSVVGEQRFSATGFDGSRRYEVVIRTERPASSVVSIGCTASGQTRPR